MKLQFLLGVLFVIGTSAIPNRRNQCEESKWKTFTSVIMDDMMKSAKNRVEKQIKGNCIDIKMPTHSMNTLVGCAIKNIMKAIVKRMKEEGYVFNILAIHKDILQCELEKSGIFNEGSINKNIYIDYIDNHINELAKDIQTKDLLMNCFKNCSDANLVPGTNGIQQILDTKICMTRLLIEQCETLNKDPGVMAQVVKAISTLLEKPKCVVQIDEKYLTGDYKDCLIESNKNWMINSGNKENKKKYLKRTMKYQMKGALEFIKAYIQVILRPTLRCTMEKAGNFNRTTLEIFKDNRQNLIQKFAWENNEERDKVVQMMNDCNSKEDKYMKISDQNDLIDEETRDAAMKQILYWKMKQEKCFMPQFIDFCGLNNDLAKMLYPILNPDFVEILIQDLQSKKEVRSVTGLGMYFKDDITKLMKEYKN